MLEKTKHEILNKDSRNVDYNTEINLVVTSPPYPMVEMWDKIFSNMNKDIKNLLDEGNGYRAFEKMHKELDKVWKSLSESMPKGSIICINIGDATRRLDGEFKLYPNRDRIVEFFINNNFEMLPGCIWRKISTGSSKFKGSYMLPPNSYFSHDHEHILIFRKGEKRNFKPHDKNRYQSSYFWREQNEWFSDIWKIKGARQEGKNLESRERLAAFPFEIPFRLINMFSVYQDTVVDPFCGTGTTNEASALLGRNSIGVDLDLEAPEIFRKRLEGIKTRSKNIINTRIEEHLESMEEKDAKYNTEHYDFKVKTKQEKGIKFYNIKKIKDLDNNKVEILYESYNHSK